MGELFTTASQDSERLREFTRHLLNDIQALETMLEENRIETGVRRIGVEQELVLVDQYWRPAPIAVEMLAKLKDDPRYVSEIARFNLEFNLDAMEFCRGCLKRMEEELNRYLDRARRTAGELGADVVLAGILPTIRKSDLTLENMVPEERYLALNDVLSRLRGGKPYEMDIHGTDELKFTHDNVMIEACNTSFQVHFQVDPDEFARRYNIAQAAAGPVLAAAVNSPLLGHYRLWRETRIALFQQSIDTRQGPYQRGLRPRVHFGTHWVKESVLEIFQEDIARYKVLFAVDIDEDPFAALAGGRPPALRALRLHNGTVYRWNRACYGISEGKPHLRIENRVLPAGPTTADEVANAAFWFGLMSGLSEEYGDITEVMDFDWALDNFHAAARHGLHTQFTWVGGEKFSAQDLILQRLLPLSREGLLAAEVDPGHVDHYLGILEKRVRDDRTGANWMLDSLAEMKHRGTRGEHLNALVAGMATRQKEGRPVHVWSLATLEEGGGWKQNYLRVDQYMTTDLTTVRPDAPIDLVYNLMLWNQVRHVMVEDDEHTLLGLISFRHLLKLAGRVHPKEEGHNAPASTIMLRDPITVTPETTTSEVLDILRRERVSCLPVVKEGRLVGVVTEDNFLSIAQTLLEEKLNE